MMESKYVFIILALCFFYMITASASYGKSAYLGPLGSFTSEAAMEYFEEHFPNEELIPMKYDEMFAAYKNNEITNLCVPMTTSVVGLVGRYIDEILKLDQVTIIGEYPKPIVYSLLSKRGAEIGRIKTVVSHPVALEEAKPWLDEYMPGVLRKTALSTGAAAKQLSEGNSLDSAVLGPEVNAEIYDLEVLAAGIEEGPHNVTRFCILGRDMPNPTGNDKTTLVVRAVDSEFNDILGWFSKHRIKIIGIFERPSKVALEEHYYVFDVEGHSKEMPLAGFLNEFSSVRLLGSYPRQF